MDLSSLNGRLYRLTISDDGDIELYLMPATPEPAPVVPRETNVPDMREIAWGAKVSQTFRNRVCWSADKFGWDASDLMSVMAFETGETFSPKVKNPNASATGLIQFLEKTARSLGTSTYELARMTAEDQLSFVHRYLEGVGAKRARDIDSIYMCVFMPAHIASPVSETIISKSQQAYAVNKGLDLNRDGLITKAEAGAKVRAARAKGLLPGNVWRGEVQTGATNG